MREKMQGTSRLKALNQQAILRFLLRFEGATKSGIAQATGLSVAACTALLDEMIADGRVRELEHAAPRGGRPARRFALDAEREHLLALRCERADGESRMDWRVLDLQGRELRGGRELCEAPLEPEAWCAAVARRLAEDPKIAAVAAGFPGVVDRGRVQICDFQGLIGFDAETALRERFGVRAAADNDTNCIALGYYHLHGFQADDSVSAVLWNRDVYSGSGSVVGGRVVRGATSFAGELSYVAGARPRAERLAAFSNPETFLDAAAEELSGLIAVLNPRLVVATGTLTVSHTPQEFARACKHFIPDGHLPEFAVAADVSAEYTAGLYRSLLERELVLQNSFAETGGI